MAEFNKPGVPYYAHPDTPAPRPRELPPLPQEIADGKANQMIARRHVRTFIKDNWKEGDRFIITPNPLKKWDHYLKCFIERKSEQAGLSGIFKELKLCGTAWFVHLSWDDPTYKAKGLGRNRLGMFEFYYYAFKEGEVYE
jgi:hypothetical protein